MRLRRRSIRGTVLCAKLSANAKTQFLGNALAPLEGSDSLSSTEAPPTTFLVVDIEPSLVDYL